MKWTRFARVAAAVCVLLAMRCDARAAQTPDVQTWFTVTPESQDAAVALPADTTYRFGTPNCAAGTLDMSGNPLAAPGPVWATVTVSVDTSIANVSQGGAENPFPFGTVCYGVAKEFDVLETAAAQIVMLNGVAVQVPALPPPAAPAPTPLATGQHTVVLSAVYPPPGDASATWFGAGNLLPGGGGSSTWESSAFTITVDGQTLVCTYKADAYTSNQFTFSCTAQ
jgi:hypothetical protein